MRLRSCRRCHSFAKFQRPSASRLQSRSDRPPRPGVVILSRMTGVRHAVCRGYRGALANCATSPDSAPMNRATEHASSMLRRRMVRACVRTTRLVRHAHLVSRSNTSTPTRCARKTLRRDPSAQRHHLRKAVAGGMRAVEGTAQERTRTPAKLLTAAIDRGTDSLDRGSMTNGILLEDPAKPSTTPAKPTDSGDSPPGPSRANLLGEGYRRHESRAPAPNPCGARLRSKPDRDSTG